MAKAKEAVKRKKTSPKQPVSGPEAEKRSRFTRENPGAYLEFKVTQKDGKLMIQETLDIGAGVDVHVTVAHLLANRANDIMAKLAQNPALLVHAS